MTRRSYSMRQCLDLVIGILVLLIGLAGSAALELAQRQRSDAILVQALHDEQRFVYELSALAQRSVGDQTDPVVATAGRLAVFGDGVARLERNLQAVQTGGTFRLNDGRTLRVRPTRGRWIKQNIQAALLWLRVAQNARSGEEPLATMQEAFRHRGHELRTLLEGVAASVESQAVDRVVQMSAWQLALMVCGIGFFLFGVLLLRHLVTTPLHRMADGIAAMQATGRLVKLPAPHDNELGIVADGFNHLAQHVEEQKARLRDHIVELQRVNAELDQLAHVKDDFLATVNHQLRTPLTTLVEGVELLRDGAMGPLSEEQMAMVRTMDESGERLTTLVEDILDLIMLRSGRRPLARQPSDAGALLRRCQTIWQSVSNTRTISLACGNLPQVYIDAQAISEVMDHLLRNALRHAPEHSDITMTSRVQGGFVEVAVQDRGPGISSEQLKLLFQPFTHIQTPDAPGSQGNGLGLAFCRQVIERHRGTIRAQSLKGRGTTVTFTLPVASPHFLFQEACETVRETASFEGGQFALLVVHPEGDGLMDDAAAALRKNTHRNDTFVRLDERTLVILAVTDRPGLSAMIQRLQRVLTDATLRVRIGTALSPYEGTSPEQLLTRARQGLSGVATGAYATMLATPSTRPASSRRDARRRPDDAESGRPQDV